MHIVKISAARMPSRCWGRYVHVAVIEVEPGIRPHDVVISERSRGVRRIVDVWRKCNVGKTARSASERALSEARALAAKLNAGFPA